jgi:hemin uptake protein HemP
MNARTPFPDTLSLSPAVGAAMTRTLSAKIDAARGGIHRAEMHPARDPAADEAPRVEDRARHALPMTDLPVHDAQSLTQGGAQALIHLDGKIYTLRITRAGKLILTK